jgi:hypothetical protein
LASSDEDEEDDENNHNDDQEQHDENAIDNDLADYAAQVALTNTSNNIIPQTKIVSTPEDTVEQNEELSAEHTAEIINQTTYAHKNRHGKNNADDDLTFQPIRKNKSNSKYNDL